MELNAEQIKKELVLFIDDMPVELHFSRKRTLKFSLFLKDILFVILANEQKIFELENRLKECENGYSGTLALERAKIKELTEENERLRAEVRKLNIVAENTDAALYAFQHFFDIRADTVREMRSILYEEFLKVARCQKSGEPNMKSQEVFAILDRIAKEMLEGK